MTTFPTRFLNHIWNFKLNVKPHLITAYKNTDISLKRIGSDKANILTALQQASENNNKVYTIVNVGVSIVFADVNKEGHVKAIWPSCKAQRTKIPPACLLAINGVKPTIAGDDISNNRASEWAETRCSESDANQRGFPSSLITSHTVTWVIGLCLGHLSSIQPSVINLSVSLTCLCALPTVWLAGFTAEQSIDRQGHGRRTRPPLASFIFHRKFDKF